MQSVKKKRLKTPFKILFLVIILAIIGGVIYFISTREKPEPVVVQQGSISEVEVENKDLEDLLMQDLRFFVLDVGQGQSIFIDCGETEILIDGSTQDYGKTVADFIKPYVDGEIEYIIATHSDLDHVGGLNEVLRTYKVNTTICGSSTDEPHFKIFEEDAKKYSKTYMNETSDLNLNISVGKNASLTVMDPPFDAEIDNNNSLVCLLKHGSKRFFFSGDAEEAEETTFKGKLNPCDVVVAGHHGSSSSNTLVGELSPKYFVISAKKDNDYGFPHKRVLEDAFRTNAKCFGTWKTGNIEFLSNGQVLTCNFDETTELTFSNPPLN